MNIISFDPSGSHGDKEGWGTTGWTMLNTHNNVFSLHQVDSKKYETPEAYWNAHTELIHMGMQTYGKDLQVVVEGYRLYENKAQSQSQSTFMTCQLIGVLKYYCFIHGIPIKIQFASEVKIRWSEDVMAAVGMLEKRGVHYYHNGKLTNGHQRDSLKHALHFARYKAPKEVK